MNYHVLLFTGRNKPDTEKILTISDRMKEIFGYYTKTVSGNFYVIVKKKVDLKEVTAFCYGMRELWNIIK